MQNCLWNRHGLKLAPLLRKSTWVCLACTGACNCAVCLRKQGKDPYDEDAVDFSFLNSVRNLKISNSPVQAKSLDEVGVILSEEHSELMSRTDAPPQPRPKKRDWHKKKTTSTAEEAPPVVSAPPADDETSPVVAPTNHTEPVPADPLQPETQLQLETQLQSEIQPVL